MDKKTKKQQHVRLGIQALWALVSNSYLLGFVQGKIYQGPLKRLCLPGLNCYSCPGALGSCPIGAFQAVIGGREHRFPFFVAGFLIFLGALTGRFVCGFLCPFGLIQELLHKIPFFKKIGTFRGDKLLRKLKYVIFAVFVVLLPLFAVDLIGQGPPWFCKLLCPAGTLEGGVPLVLLGEGLRGAIGWLYAWKNALLIALLLLSILIYRPFCKYLCPLGAVYSLFNGIAVLRHRVDESKCVGCGACAKACPMQVDPRRRPNDAECIRCGICRSICPTDAIEWTHCLKK